MVNHARNCGPLQNAKPITFKDRLFASALLLLWSYYPAVPFKVSYAVFLLWFYCLTLPFKIAYMVYYAAPRAILRWILRYLGFMKDGVAKDSWASRYQSAEYRGHIPRDSHFALYQSLGAGGSYEYERKEEKKRTPGLFMGIVGWGAFVASGYVFFGMMGSTNPC